MPLPPNLTNGMAQRQTFLSEGLAKFASTVGAAYKRYRRELPADVQADAAELLMRLGSYHQPHAEMPALESLSAARPVVMEMAGRLRALAERDPRPASPVPAQCHVPSARCVATSTLTVPGSARARRIRDGRCKRRLWLAACRDKPSKPPDILSETHNVIKKMEEDKRRMVALLAEQEARISVQVASVLEMAQVVAGCMQGIIPVGCDENLQLPIALEHKRGCSAQDSLSSSKVPLREMGCGEFLEVVKGIKLRLPHLRDHHRPSMLMICDRVAHEVMPLPLVTVGSVVPEDEFSDEVIEKHVRKFIDAHISNNSGELTLKDILRDAVAQLGLREKAYVRVRCIAKDVIRAIKESGGPKHISALVCRTCGDIIDADITEVRYVCLPCFHGIEGVMSLNADDRYYHELAIALLDLP